VTWAPGETIVVQEVWRGRLWAARPMRVVEDRDGFVALWFPKGTCWKAPTTPPDRPRPENRGQRLCACLAAGEWVFADREWDTDTLWLLRDGDAHAIWASWRDGEPWGWYVNLQEPFTRTPRALQTMDQMLDVIVETDGSWSWKDEDEFQALLDWGLIDEADAGEIRREAERVIDRAEANEPPFSEPWHGWRPDPSWARPVLPDGWDRLS
jgi:Protein of unknown function (DUF402)